MLDDEDDEDDDDEEEEEEGVAKIFCRECVAEER
jgi:hypothetical protein